ncbi:hypothetical protein HK098_001246 [Nowakowskiella sp. JEL0407]|nr:hypothetical protein HK098_001246 [Nowakowskiella sp. JEL0407]
MVGEADIKEVRLGAATFDLARMLHDRFGNLFAIAQFEISGEDVTITGAKVLQLYSKRPDRFQNLPLTYNNYTICYDATFAALVEKCRRILARDSVEFLLSREYRLLAIHIVSQECVIHGEDGVSIHTGHQFAYHPEEMDRMHPGDMVKNICNQPMHYNCCNRGPGGEGCREFFCCCNSLGHGCRMKCGNCNQDRNSLGCTGTRKNCGKVRSGKECLVQNGHQWASLKLQNNNVVSGPLDNPPEKN